MNPWQVLGIAQTEDTRAIKQAYARALKQTRPDSDPEGYQRLRECYEWALEWVEWQRLDAPDSALEDEQASTGHSIASSTESAAMSAVPSLSPAIAAPADVFVDGASREASAAADAPSDSAEGLLDSVPPQALLRTWHAFWQDHGDAALVDALPQLRSELALVPLEHGGHASAVFAGWVVDQHDLPWSVVEALQDWFGWAKDFMAERALGTELTAALHERLGLYGLLNDSDGVLAEHCRPLLELQRRQREQPAWRSLLFALSLPGQLASLLGAGTSAQGYLHTRLGEQGLSELRRVFFVLQSALLAGLGVVAFAVARLAGLDGLASAALSAGAMAAALATAGFAPLLLVPLDAALRAVRETVPGPLEPGPVRSLVAISLAALALAWSLGAFRSPTVWGWLGLSIMAVLMAWNPNSAWRSLLIPTIGVTALALLRHFPETLTPGSALCSAALWILMVDLACQRLSLHNLEVQGPMGGLIIRVYLAIAWIALTQALFGKTVVGPLLLIALLASCAVAFLNLATQQGAERVLAWLGATVLTTELLLPGSQYQAFALAVSPVLLWLLLRILSALGRAVAGSPARRS
jgi:hypothetical protein